MVSQLRYPAVHRTILAVDIQGFGDLRRNNPNQIAVREGMYRSLRLAFEVAGIPWDACRPEDRGDSVFFLISPEVHKAVFVEMLPPALAEALHQHNGTHPPEEQIRMRMVLHAGEVNYDEHGVAATSVNLAFRLIDAPQLKAALNAAAGSTLAVIVSEWFFDEVVRHCPGVDAASYRQVTTVVKETTARAYISVPDQPGGAGRPDRSDAAGPHPTTTVTEWQNRRLDHVYPVLVFDQVQVRVRAGQAAVRTVHLALAVTVDGLREILGLWVGDADEDAEYWQRALLELRRHGLRDPLIVVCGGLTGLPQAAAAVWPRVVLQPGILHLRRRSSRYAGGQDWTDIANALKPIYSATGETAAWQQLAHFDQAWSDRYPAVVNLWRHGWSQLRMLFTLPVEIRRVICSTNAADDVHAALRREVKARGQFATEQAALKYVTVAAMVIDTAAPARRWTTRWRAALNAFELAFPDRLTDRSD
jgi:hypothetical protein